MDPLRTPIRQTLPVEQKMLNADYPIDIAGITGIKFDNMRRKDDQIMSEFVEQMTNQIVNTPRGRGRPRKLSKSP